MRIDLQYAGFLHSHSLWTNDTDELSMFNFVNRTAKIDENIAIEISKNEVLGKRIEHFFEYYIISQNQYEILIKNLQIFRDKITIGELDFLIRDITNNKTFHVELVYKFYLYIPEASAIELERWIGPNRKDSLLEKTKKLTKKQFPLLFREETRPILDELDLKPSEIIQEVCFLGNLFIPLSYKKKSLPIINNQCIVGYWIRTKEFTQQEYNTSFFSIPEKQDWVTNPNYCDKWVSYEEILPEIKLLHLQKKSPLLWLKNKEDSFSKFFIVWW